MYTAVWKRTTRRDSVSRPDWHSAFTLHLTRGQPDRDPVSTLSYSCKSSTQLVQYYYDMTKLRLARFPTGCSAASRLSSFAHAGPAMRPHSELRAALLSLAYFIRLRSASE